MHKLLDELEATVPQSLLEIKVFLTAQMDVGDIQNIMLHDPQAEIDPVTELTLTRCNYGRPNWNKLFKEIYQEADMINKDSIKVGVFYCGPKALATSIEICAKNISTNKIVFKFKREHF